MASKQSGLFEMGKSNVPDPKNVLQNISNVARSSSKACMNKINMNKSRRYVDTSSDNLSSLSEDEEDVIFVEEKKRTDLSDPKQKSSLDPSSRQPPINCFLIYFKFNTCLFLFVLFYIENSFTRSIFVKAEPKQFDEATSADANPNHNNAREREKAQSERPSLNATMVNTTLNTTMLNTTLNATMVNRTSTRGAKRRVTLGANSADITDSTATAAGTDG
jgi:hypothetical protein